MSPRLMQPTAEARRLFLALWPEPVIREQLAQLSALLTAGRRIPAANLHMTLVFLGASTAARQHCYEKALDALSATAFQLCLERLVYRRRSGILWLAPNAIPPALNQLSANLNHALQDCGFNAEKRPFKAHITLARHYPAKAWPLPPTADVDEPLPIDWQITCFTLVESVFYPGGVHYRPLREWTCH